MLIFLISKIFPLLFLCSLDIKCTSCVLKTQVMKSPLQEEIYHCVLEITKRYFLEKSNIFVQTISTIDTSDKVIAFPSNVERFLKLTNDDAGIPVMTFKYDERNSPFFEKTSASTAIIIFLPYRLLHRKRV